MVFQRIEAFLPLSDKSVLIGIGDDAAAVRVSKEDALTTTDPRQKGYI